MRVSKQTKERRHQDIVYNAARLVRENGVEQTSVAAVMQASQLTHGGFYRHFTSKEALVDSALTRAFDQLIQPYIEDDEGQPQIDAERFVHDYLSSLHIQTPAEGCPVATLGAEMARSAQGGESAMAKGVARLVDALSAGLAPGSPDPYGDALGVFSTLIGAVILARLLPDQHDQVTDAAKALIDNHIHIEQEKA